MRMLALSLAGLLAAATAQAADKIRFAADDIVDSAAGDWNRDGHQDLAILAVTGHDVPSIGIYAWLRDPERGLLRPVLEAPGKVWGSTLKEGFEGQEPSIRALPNGSIAIGEQNFAIGRERWEHTLTLAWRGERFLVAGYTFNYYDSLQEMESLDCDLNLLTGRGIVNGKAVTFPAMSIAPEDWRSEGGTSPGREVCKQKR